MRGPSRGLTLVETLMVSAVFAIVGGALMVTSRSMQQASLQQDADRARALQAQKAVDRMAEDLRNASSTIGLACGANQLTMTIPGAPNTAVTYSCAGCSDAAPGVLLRATNPATITLTIASGITVFTSVCATVPGGSVATLTLAAQTRGNSLQRALTTTLTTKVWIENP